MTRKILAPLSLAVALALPAVAHAEEPPKWYLGSVESGQVVTETTHVLLSGKLTFHYFNSSGAGTKYVTQCSAPAEGTISNFGPKGSGIDEITSGELTGCVSNKEICTNGEPEKPFFRTFPFESSLAAGLPARDELNIREVGIYCGGALYKSSGAIVTPLVKNSGLVFDKGHGLLLGNGNITVTGTWKIKTATGQKVAAS